MGKIFITSDTHFGHDREFIYGPRGFTSIEEHDKEIIRRWNEVVGPDDTVFHLGDVMLGDNTHGMECLRQLNGTIYIVAGNHDTPTRLALYETLENVHVFTPAVGGAAIPGMTAGAIYFKYKKYNFYLSHHPTITSNLEAGPFLRMHLINLYGHTHQMTKFYEERPYMFHVGMDSNNCTPILLDDAIALMKLEVQKCIELLQNKQEQIEIQSIQHRGCSKCVHEFKCADSCFDRRCERYKRDPPDGGYYG